MSLYKRNDSPYWWVKLSHDGNTLQRSTGTSDRRKAKEYHDKLQAQWWDATRLGLRPSHSWQEAVMRWLEEKAHKKSLRDDRLHFRWLHPYLGQLQLSEIDRNLVDRLTKVRQGQGVSNATVNRMLSLLRSVLKAAVNDWEWLDHAPKVRLLPEPRRRVRFLTQPEAARLLSVLPPHLMPMVRFSLLTGLRQRNVRELRWSQLDLDRSLAWIHADEAKGGKPIPVPLTQEAVALIRQQQGKHAEFVFTYEGNPIRWLHNTGWRNALKRAGIEDFRWHDLRHTFATWHVQAGTPLHVLQELGGWSSPEMVKRYAHFTPGHLASYVERFGEAVRVNEKGSYDLATLKEVTPSNLS